MATKSSYLILGAALFSQSCIGPQGAKCPCECKEGAANTAESGDPATGAAAAADVPPAIKPTGALIYDGTSNMLSNNIEPPGSWFSMNDGSPKGSMVPASTGDIPGLATGSLRSHGAGYGEWGGGIGFNFVGHQMITPADATAFKGIKFKASGKGVVHVGLATVATMPEFAVCSKCYDHFAADINLTSELKEYAYKWEDLRQGGWGTKAKLDPATLIGFNFTSKGPTSWDFTIDEIAFIE